MLETRKRINPICIGPEVLHKRKLQSSYYTLLSSIAKYHPETRNVLVIGTNGEENLWNVLFSVFADSTHVRYDMHLKDNVKRKLSELNNDLSAARETKDDIFGVKLESVQDGGLVDFQLEKEYDEASEVIIKRCPPLPKNAKSFLEYFLAGPANTIQDSICWTGFPSYCLHSECQ